MAQAPVKTTKAKAEDAFMDLEKLIREWQRSCKVSNIIVTEWSRENKVFVVSARFPYVSET